MEFKGSEKRRFPRIECTCRATVDSLIKVFTFHTIDISEGGIRGDLGEKLNTLLGVNLELTLKNGKKVKCKGRVVRVRKKHALQDKQPVIYDTGIEFEGLREADRKLIKDALNDRGF